MSPLMPLQLPLVLALAVVRSCGPLLPILALAALGALLRVPVVKGWIGEMLLHLRLRLSLDPKCYRLFHNLILPTPDGSTQVDHVVVSKHGIFVIETKHFAGWIFGKATDRMWTQKFPRRSFAFQNPLRQNYKHVRALAALTGADERALFSLVVFLGSCTFKTPMPDNVTRAGACLAAIRARTEVLLSDAEVEAIVERIAGGRAAPSRAANAAHARHVRALVAARREPHAGAGSEPSAGASAAAACAPAEPTCPRCNSALGAYTYSTGVKAGLSFCGCTRFPQCDYRFDLAATEAAAT